MKLHRQLAWMTLISISSLASGVAQSLGDVARQQQEAKKTSTSQSKHVITNDDISSGSKATDSAAKPATKKSATTSASQPSTDADRPSAEEIQAGIKEQREKIQEIEAHMKEVQQELQTWKNSDCTHVLHSDTLTNACDDLQRINTDLARTKDQLDQEKKNLASMQEDARKMGFANSVYDPN